MNRIRSLALASALLILDSSMVTMPALGARQQVCPVVATSADPLTFDHQWAGTIFDIYSPDGIEAWTVEEGGRIRHRTVAGAWDFQSVPKEVQDTLHRIHFLSNRSTGWAVGEEGWILKTTNGGSLWEVQGRMPGVDPDEGPWENLYDVYFKDASNGWLLGKKGLWYSTDGGWCWTPCILLDEFGAPADFAADHIELYALDIYPGICACCPPCGCPIGVPWGMGIASGEPGLFYKTEDGLTWQQVFDVRSKCTAPPSFASQCGTLIDEICAGTMFYEPWDVEIRRNAGSPLILVVGGVGPFNCGMIFASSDKGCTWVEELHECWFPNPPHHCIDIANPLGPPDPLNMFVTLYGVGIFDGDGSAIACGYGGQHIQRDPGPAGQIWHDRSSFGHPESLSGDTVIFPMYAAEANAGNTTNGKGWIAGTGNVIRYTTNGGTTQGGFTNEGGDDDEFRIHDVFFTSTITGWYSGQFHRLAKSGDEGHSFQKPLIGVPFDINWPYLHAIAFGTNSPNGVAVGKSDSNSTTPELRYTTDNASWTDATNSVTWAGPTTDYQGKHLWEVDWARDPSSLEYWTVGDKGIILRSIDGGQIWTQLVPTSLPLDSLKSYDFESISCYSQTEGFIVGMHTDALQTKKGVAFKYQLVGVVFNWTPVFDGLADGVSILMDVDAPSSTTAYAVGRKGDLATGQGLVYRWTGGLFEQMSGAPVFVPCNTIEEIEGGIEPIVEVEAVAETNVWVAGHCGRIWQYNGSSWTEHKSQTDSHTEGLCFPTSTRGYLSAQRDGIAQSCLVRIRL